jgi:hypothetical protein
VLGPITVSSSPERIAVVVFGLNLTLAALMVYLMLPHAGRTPGLAAGDVAEEELRAFARERRSAVLLQAGADAAHAADHPERPRPTGSAHCRDPLPGTLAAER